MPIDERFKQTAIIGAAGKMGRGISLLVLQEAARLQTHHQKPCRLVCIDTSLELLEQLRTYLVSQLRKHAERSIIQLRYAYAHEHHLIDNEQIVQSFVDGTIQCVHFSTSVEAAKGSTLIFEAIVEKLEVKVEVLKACKKVADPQALFLSNTSSIPIHLLDSQAGMEGRIIGFHFYNPPPIQRLLEMIKPEKADPKAYEEAREVAHRFQKIIVDSADIAGFIGNGHFVREVVFACHKVEELAQKQGTIAALTTLDAVTRDYLIRPMGIFQLVDYVGLDVGVLIASVMRTYLKDRTIAFPLLEAFVAKGVRGGQNPDGSQRDGIFKYNKGIPVEVFDLETGAYQKLPKVALGQSPEGLVPWKYAQRDPQASDKLDVYLNHLFQSNTEGAFLAKEFLTVSCKIAQNLVSSGVAYSLQDVDRVLKLGFYHLYGTETVMAHVKNSFVDGVLK